MKLVGTVAAALLDVSVTTAPPVGAGVAKVTVPVDVAPPVTEIGLNVSPVKNGVPIARKISEVLPCPDPM
jgi:hypothetical protein